MIDHAKFMLIKEKYGHYASWAVWAEGAGKPKDNIGDLSIFEIEENAGLLRQLKPEVVLVGLNISRGIRFPLGNFHDGRSHSMDYKLRYALKGTSLWGAYMTDIIKDFEQKAPGKMMAYLRSEKSFEKDNVEQFREELRDLGVGQPSLIAFGEDAFKVLSRNLGEHYDVWKMPHYSNYGSKEKYREQIGSIIESQVNQRRDVACAVKGSRTEI
jgi:hypothetical protein